MLKEPIPLPDIWAVLESFEDFQAWYPKHVLAQQSIDAALEKLQKHGIHSHFFGDITPDDISVLGTDHREQLIAKGLNARQRALLECLAQQQGLMDHPDPKIYAPEAITPLAMALKARYRFFIGSEFYSNQHDHWLYPVLHQDLTQLDFQSATFDVVLSSDVLEHVPDLERALSEMVRVLKPGGVMLSAHPFTWQACANVKARLINGETVFTGEPEYHQNPADPATGSLVYTIPGWDVLELCKRVGFSRAEMILIASTSLGILATNPPFINVLRAYR